MEARYLSETIRHDALEAEKIAFVSGPRQVGKSTLAKELLTSDENYFVYDNEDFRKAWTRSPDHAIENRGNGPIVLDEIHKDRLWKRKVKGLYDSASPKVPIIVTGSARLETYRRGGDSLLGRYIPYRLHPFSVGESARSPNVVTTIDTLITPRFSWSDLLKCGGFPEPFLKGKEAYALRWSRLRLERLVTEDVRDIKVVTDTNSLLLLAELLPSRVGSPLSINSLREDLNRSHSTIANWIDILEALYFCFRISPYSKRVSRSVTQEKKLYLYDILRIPKDDKGARIENLTALHLLKAVHFWNDSGEGEFDLHFLKTRDGKEVDFLITKEKKPWLLVECKSSDTSPSPTLCSFVDLLKPPLAVQLVATDNFYREYPQKAGVKVIGYERFFAQLI
jgi:uncharacterized protein